MGRRFDPDRAHMIEKSIFHKFHTNKKIISNTVLFATFKIFFNYKEIPTISFYNKNNYLEIREIVRGKILREKVILNEAGHLIISEKYPPITSPSTQILRIKNRYFVKLKFKVRSVKIHKAFYISQKKSEIFYHAVNWVLPQIIFIGFFENTNAFKKILIIDKSLHKRIKDLLYFWIEHESKNWIIVECSNQEILKVESLKIVSSKQTNLIATNLLSKNDANYLRNKFKLLLDSKTSIPKAKRIFLKRDYDARSTIGRNLENTQQIEEFFLKNSFQIYFARKNI